MRRKRTLCLKSDVIYAQASTESGLEISGDSNSHVHRHGSEITKLKNAQNLSRFGHSFQLFSPGADNGMPLENTFFSSVGPYLDGRMEKTGKNQKGQPSISGDIWAA